MGHDDAQRPAKTGPATSASDPAPQAGTTATMNVYGTAAPPDSGTRAGLVLLYAPSYAQFSPAYLLSEKDLVIGRDPQSGICVPEQAVSRQHARIQDRKSVV